MKKRKRVRGVDSYIHNAGNVELNNKIFNNSANGEYSPVNPINGTDMGNVGVAESINVNESYLEIEQGDYVDFGPYGKFYVANTNYRDDMYWVTDDVDDRATENCLGWSIYKDQARKVIERFNDDEDDYYDESVDKDFVEAFSKSFRYDDITLTYNNVDVVLAGHEYLDWDSGPQWDEEEVTVDEIEYKVSKDDVATLIIEDFLQDDTSDEVEEVLNAWYDSEDDDIIEKYVEDNFDKLFAKYYNEILDHYYDDAVEKFESEVSLEDWEQSIIDYYSDDVDYFEDYELYEDIVKHWENDTLTEDIAAVKKNYPTISDEDFNRIIALDPTFNPNKDSVGTYGKWLLNLFKKGNLNNEGHINDLLTRFEEVKNQLVNKDIMKYKSLEEVDDMLNDDNSYKNLSDRQKLRQTQKAVRGADLSQDATLVYEDSDWQVYTPHTYEASCKLGSGTRWCTASTANDHYYNYYKERYGGEYYININKHNGEKFQFHFPSNQFMNEEDYPIDIDDFITENPELANFYNELARNGKIQVDDIEIDTFSLYKDVSRLRSDLISALVDGEDLYEFFANGLSYSADEAIYHLEHESFTLSDDVLSAIKEREDIPEDEDIDWYDVSEEILDLITMAMDESYIQYQMDAVQSDFNTSKENLLSCLKSKYGLLAHWSEESPSVLIFNANENSLFKLLQDEDIIEDCVKDCINFKEPYYGWMGELDDEIINETILNNMDFI